MTVTFFGHRDCSEAIGPQLQQVLEDLIAEGADCFYVGNQGRFAITHRNRWMIDTSDCVVSYVTHGWGGAARFAELAEKKGKRVICLKRPIL